MSKNCLEFIREDDFVEYYLFPKITTKENNEEVFLNRLLQECNNLLNKYTSVYLWHKDPFKLSKRTKVNTILQNVDGDNEDLPSHLYGVTHCGDCIEDEWFIVFLLVELSKSIEDLVIRIVDADGEFLLIEAADYLPAWANPDVCDKRVYIYKGFVSIIAPEENESSRISVQEAINDIRNNFSITVASTEVQTCIKNKLKKYPDSISENLHRATVFLPIGVAAILNQNPNLVSPAVHAFCNRDSIDMKACRAMKYFPPENRVYSSVRFTKLLYAMLSHSKYVPDKKTGWNLPVTNSKDYKAHLLGCKLACGFEILISQAKPNNNIEIDKGWNLYLEKLKSSNYFKELIEHSKEYNELLNKAKEYYISNRDSMQFSPPIGTELLQLTKTLDFHLEQFKDAEKKLPEEDDDSWLNISPEELDRMLQETYGTKNKITFNCNSNASDFTGKVSEFLDHISSGEGAEFPDEANKEEEASPVRPPRGIKNKTKVSFSADTKTDAKTKINFDPNGFQCAIQNILNFAIPEDDSWNLESDSDMSDYGKDDVELGSYDEVKTKMEQYMEEMDKQLASTTIGESFVKTAADKFDDIENFRPVDIDMNALKNILESYRSQLGDAGPSSTMLGPMGIQLDADVKEDE